MPAPTPSARLARALRRYRRPRRRLALPSVSLPALTPAQATSAAGLLVTVGIALYDRLRARFGWP